MGLIVSQEIHDKCEEYEVRNYAYPLCWKDLGTKNFDYYNNKRFCKIAEGFIPISIQMVIYMEGTIIQTIIKNLGGNMMKS